MRNLLALTFSLAILAAAALSFSQTQFPIGATLQWSPKTNKTAAIAEIDDPRGIIQGLQIPFTHIRLDLTPFGYVGVQFGSSTSSSSDPATGGFGLKWLKVQTAGTFQIGGTYGAVIGDNSMHFGLVGGYEFNLTKPAAPTASVHEFYILNDKATRKAIARVGLLAA